MKKLFYILLLLTLQAAAQPVVTSGLPSGTSSFTPTFRNGAYQGYTMPWWYVSGKWYLGMTAEYANNAYAASSGSLNYVRVNNFLGSRNVNEAPLNSVGFFDSGFGTPNMLTGFPLQTDPVSGNIIYRYDFLRIGDAGRGFMIASRYDADGIYFNRSRDGSFQGWRRFAFADEIPASADVFSKSQSDARYKPINYTPDLSGYALLNSPAFTGTPTAPTPAAGTNNTQIATAAYVQNAIAQLAPTDNNYTYSTQFNIQYSGFYNFTGTTGNPTSYAVLEPATDSGVKDVSLKNSGSVILRITVDNSTNQFYVKAPCPYYDLYPGSTVTVHKANGFWHIFNTSRDAYGSEVKDNILISGAGNKFERTPNGSWYWIHSDDDGNRLQDQVNVTIQNGNARVTLASNGTVL